MRCGDEHVDYPDEFDNWHRIDLDEDGRDEYLVFLTLEGFGGGSNYSRYLVVYRYVDPVWVASYLDLVGGKGSLLVTGSDVRLADRVLTIDALFPDGDDGTCCPTVQGEIEYDVGVGGMLNPHPVEMSEMAATYQSMLMYIGGCN